MYRNAITQFVFDRDLRLRECDYPTDGVWGLMDMKRGIGQTVYELYKFIPADFKEVADTMTEALNTANESCQAVYRECTTTVQTEYLFIMILVTFRENKLQVNCMVVNEQDVYSNRHGFSSKLLTEALNRTPVGISIRKYDKLYNNDFFIFNDKMKELFDCTSDKLDDSNKWSNDEDLKDDRTALDQGGYYEYEKLVKESDGSIKRWLTVRKQITNRGNMGFLVVTSYSDRTEKRKIEIKYMNTLKGLHRLTRLSKSIMFSYELGSETIDIFGIDEVSAYTSHKFDFKHFASTIHPDDRIAYCENMDALYAGRAESFSIQCRIAIENISTEYRYYDLFSCIAKNDEGKWMIVGMARDIHYQKQSELRRRQLQNMNQLVYNNMPVGVEIYDENACLISINDKELEQFGLTRETAPIGISLYDHAFLSDEQKEMIRRKESFSMVLPFDFDKARQSSFMESKHKGIRYFDIRFTPLKMADGTFYGYMSVSMDTTEMHNKNRQLEELSKNLDIAIEVGDIAFWTYDPKTKIYKSLKGNALAGEGLTLEKSLELIHPEDKQMYIDALNDVMTKKVKTSHCIYRFMAPDGTYHSYEGRLIADVENGEVVRMSGTQRDVTQKLKASETNKKYVRDLKEYGKTLAEIVNNIPSLLTIKDATEDFSFTTVNRNFLEVVGRKKEDFIGRPLRTIYPKEICDFYISRDQEAIDKNCVTECEEHLTIRGREYYWKAVRAPMKLVNGHTYVIDIYTDITSLKQANMDLTKAKEKAEQSDKLKSKFLANMSHEIRTPLNAIVGFSEILSSAGSDEEREEYHKIIERNSQQLLRLINDILDLSKIEAGTMTMQIEQFDAKEAVLSAIESARCGLNGKPIVMNSDIPYKECNIEFDRYRFNQILNNYLSNAVKYTQQGSITASLECTDSGVKFIVSDTGIGIAEDNFSRVFGRFNKFDDFAQGTGLGLSICKAITDSIGGEVGFKSKIGEGSTFWAWIPCKVKA